MNRCKTCKWWQGWHSDERRKCYHNKIDGPEGGLPDGLFTLSHRPTGETFTGPDFGCVHHEVKE